MSSRDVNEAEVELTIREPDELIEEKDEPYKYRFIKKIGNAKIVVIAYWYKDINRYVVKTLWRL